MTDLELIQLAEEAKQGLRGEKGAQGVGIRSIEQSGVDSFTINLTDGTSKEIKFPKPKDGEPGPAGPAGKDGNDSTATGRQGPPGPPGRDGLDGADGAPGASVDSAVVDSRGHLLIGMTDGRILDVGRVVGPAGLVGERGPVGLSGAPGRDGNTILSGYKAPNDAEDGQDGDFFIDLSSPQFDFYGPKRGGEWGGRTTFLKQPPAPKTQPMKSFPVGSGAGSGGGGGGMPPFEVYLDAGVETEITRFTGDQAIMIYKIKDSLDATAWGAGQFNTAATELLDDAEFTIAAELIGTGGMPAFTMRVERLASNQQMLIVHATAAVSCWIKGRIVTTA